MDIIISLLVLMLLSSVVAQSPMVHGCSESAAAVVQQRWKSLLNQMSGSEKVSIYEALAEHITTDDDILATLLNADHSTPSLLVAQRLLTEIDLLVNMLGDAQTLHSHLRHVAITRTDWARTFFGHFHVVAEAVVSVFGRLSLSGPEKITWSSCLATVAMTSRHVLNSTVVSARCDVIADSGDPQFPITGDVILTQPVFGGLTTLRVNLGGFTTTTRHGFHVHAVGSTDNRCLLAGGHFNPSNRQHGSPLDQERHVGDLGNIQADREGKVVLKFKDTLVSLYGTNNVIGRAIVIHKDEDDLGQGGFSDSKTTGHAGARIACCVVRHL